MRQPLMSARDAINLIEACKPLLDLEEGRLIDVSEALLLTNFRNL
jgi:hypothetical protein